MARRSNRRQFVWARTSGVIGPGAAAGGFAQDLLEQVRLRHGEGVLRGATVMGIRGYARPNPQTLTVPVKWRFAVRVVNFDGLTDVPVQAGMSPWSDPEADWMLFQQYVTTGTSDASTPGSSARGSRYAVESQASRKFEELGQTLTVFADAIGTDNQPVESGVFDYDLSIGLKLP